MSDIEKNGTAHGHGHGHSQVPIPGAGPVDAPYTLGANPVQQHFYQGNAPSLRIIANPAPLGLFSFASTTLILSLINVQTRGVTAPNIVLGMALFVGGTAQFLAGMWEFAAGNTFGATAFSSYGGFWLAYAMIFIPGTGILDAYADNADARRNGVAFFLTAWFIFTFIMLIASLRSNFGLISLFFCLTVTFMLLMIADYVNNVTITKAGGWFGIVTAFIAYYCGAANLLTRSTSFFLLPLGPIPKND